MNPEENQACTPLPPYALAVANTCGRHYSEPEHPYRNAFQRDRDRIIHSAHFRRLEYKTQVFVNGEGDNYRTRLTHTLEVNQIARTIARALGINEDLAEAVALSHDLGHTPFGHAGERVLQGLMAGEGGFDHNIQGLRIVDRLEARYAAFTGLNLTYEVREAFFQHSGRKVTRETEEFIPARSPLLEVQATLVADDIAYIAHDVDDGLYSGLLDPGRLAECAVWREATAGEGFAAFRPGLHRTEGVRRLINLLVSDAVETTRAKLNRGEYADISAIFSAKEPIVTFSPGMEKKKSELKKYLFANFYRHQAVMKVMEKAQAMLEELWRYYVAEPQQLPDEYREIMEEVGVKRAVTDYLAGMTDRFLREDWRRRSGGCREADKSGGN